MFEDKKTNCVHSAKRPESLRWRELGQAVLTDVKLWRFDFPLRRGNDWEGGTHTHSECGTLVSAATAFLISVI